MHPLAAPSAPPELPPPPAPRPRRWWNPRVRATRKTPDRPCLNCGDPIAGFYCATCGQKKVDVRVSLRRMTAEAMEDELFMNATLPRTVGALLFRPGHLTREYVEGRIARYVPPFRLYLISSVLLFVLLPWLTSVGELGTAVERSTARADSLAAAQGRDTASVEYRSQQRFTFNLGSSETESLPRLLRPMNRRMVEVEERLNAMPTHEAVRLLSSSFLEHAPTGVFLMMPLFAAILKVLYVRRRRFYVEHFVFALHVHAFTFLTFLLMLLLPWKGVNALLSLWLVIYLFLAMKRVYGQGIVKTFLKFSFLGWSYSFILVAGVLFTVLLTAFTI
jgi:hypothetical protein